MERLPLLMALYVQSPEHFDDERDVLPDPENEERRASNEHSS